MSGIRFKKVLQENKELFGRVLIEEYLANYVEDIYTRYEILKDENYGSKDIYTVYLDFAEAIHAIYDYLMAIRITREDALDLLCQLCMHTTDQVLDHLSFIQLAYYYSVNKAYLKLLLTHSLTSLDSLKLAQVLEEQTLDHELSKSMEECHVKEYFSHYRVEELMDIVYVMEHAVDIFLDKYMKKARQEKVVERIV